jgi:hypothetical protein
VVRDARNRSRGGYPSEAAIHASPAWVRWPLRESNCFFSSAAGRLYPLDVIFTDARIWSARPITAGKFVRPVTGYWP